MTFRVGQEVVCVAETWSALRGRVPSAPLPYKGEVLVIESIREAMGLCCLSFAEYPKALFTARRFRPVVKTDISIFTAMLISPKKKVTA